ncbi:MAG: SDR family NAD(P)-dependent oxidoreductase, partial [Rhodospirillaceae bacterium]
MTDDLAKLFARSAAEMERFGLARYPDLARAEADADRPERSTFVETGELLRHSAVDPSACLLAAAGAGLFPTRQPPDDLPDSAARNRFVLQSLERRDYRVRTALLEDLPALSALERQCWAPGLRTPEAVLERRIAGYPRGQLVLSIDDAVVGVIYSQRIPHPGVLDGATAATVDSLHDASANVAQLLAVNVLPEMQQRNLGDQLLEFMLVYLSQQECVASVVAVTLCKNFDAASGGKLETYIRQRNEHGVLADPILRFHELHGARIERIMPGYRPDDLKNGGCGVLVGYDIHRRRRADLQPEADLRDTAARRGTSLPEIRADMRDVVNGCLGEERKAAFSFDRPLMEMGLDSADLLRLNEEIVQRYGVAPGPAFFFRHNTAGKVAAYLSERLAPGEELQDGRRDADEGTAKLPVPRGPAERWRERDVAIVGMACRLPGGIDTPEAFWECLQSGRSVVGELPPGRWHWPHGIDPAGRHRGIDRGGFLSDVAAFDAPFFRVSPAEAESMDPQQRMLLELSWQAIEHAGYAAESLAGSRTGVFIGASGSDYARLLDLSRRPVEAHYGTGSSMAVLANRLSYFYDLHGPSLLLDTACSSSLVAVHEAVRSIASGESAQALVGGINLILHPATSIAYYKAGMLSKDGLCRTFDRGANGYVRSEGAVMLLLKPLKDALAGRDNVYAVIRGTACNHGGLAGGLTVPNPERQARLLQAAWQDAGLDPSALGYIEAHGTGTPLGDPVEVQGIAQAFAEAAGARFGPSANGCGLGSAKTNLGHLEAAAGIAGLLKAVLCLQHRQLPPSLHFRELNEHIALSGSGLHVIDRLQPWQPPAEGMPRHAGVSSFGSGGTNAHVVVAEYPQAPAVGRPEPGGPVLFVLSAASGGQLQAYARKYADWLASAAGAAVPLARLVCQLQTGRRAMKDRLALVVADRQELIRRLEAFCADPAREAFHGEAAPARFGDLTRGRAGEAFLRSLAADGDLEKIASLWLSGADVDWSLLQGGEGVGDDGGQEDGTGRAQRIAAPTYPFARHTYWLPDSDQPAPGDREGGTEAVTQAGAAPDPGGADAEPILLAPVWRAVAGAAGVPDEIFPATDANLLVVGAGTGQLAAIRSVYPDAQSMDIHPDVTAKDLAERLGALGTLDHVVWIAPERNAAAAGEEDPIGQQRSGLLYLFRLVKALLARSCGEGTLGLTMVTWRTQAVFASENPDPAHAGVHGFAGALGREFPRWRVRALDLEGGEDWPVPEAMGLPADGDVWARRSGQWFRRSLCPVSALPDSPPAYRQNGVYVVIGGAGGIGEAWTRHVVERYRAQAIWIGRRQPDAEIMAKLEAVGQLGPAPVYIVADASDPASLDAAVATIGQRWPAVHGVIHAAVGPFDRSIAEADEQRFRDVLSAKIDATVHVARAFRTEPLDFLLYFSSVVALEKNGGLSGYAAGGAFQDAFALHLDERRGGPVKVVNWGHWDVGTATAVADATKTRLQRSGFVPIQPPEGMAALQALLSAPVRQMVLLKTSRPDLVPLVDMGQTLLIHGDATAPRIREAAPDPEASGGSVDALKPLSLFGNAALEAHLLPLFAAKLRSLGLAEGDPAEMPGGVAGFYRDWLRAGRRMLADRGAGPGAAGDPDRAWRDWEEARRGSLGHADLAAAVDLADACLRALPDILSGRLRATDVLFPGASMRRVEGVYSSNAVADHFNAVLAASLVSAIESRLRSDPDARLRILEIGAGTGGTTVAVLPRLEPYRRNIAEYAYTDVSKAFLFHAEEQFAGDHPYVRPALFDV